jgi:hypothetical protein
MLTVLQRGVGGVGPRRRRRRVDGKLARRELGLGQGGRRVRDPDLTAAAKKARAELEAVLDLLEWPEEPAISRCLDRLVQLEEGEA